MRENSSGMAKSMGIAQDAKLPSMIAMKAETLRGLCRAKREAIVKLPSMNQGTKGNSEK